MKRLLIIFIIIKLSTVSYAEQDPAFSLYLQNKLFFNPAAAGTDNKHVAHLQARKQWHKIDGPKTIVGSYQTYFKNINSGFGAGIMADEIDKMRTRSFWLTYSYRVDFDSKDNFLQFGVKAGLNQQALTNVDFIIMDPNDPSIPKNISAQTKPDFGAGLWWQWGKGFTGLAVDHLHNAKYRFDGATYTLERSVNFMAGYEHSFANNWDVQPQIFWQSILRAPLLFLEADVVFTHKKRFITGYGYRFFRKNTNPLKAQLGYRFKEKLEFRVAVDIPANFSIYGSSTEGVLLFKF